MIFDWFKIWASCFFSFVWRKDGYFNPRAKYVTIGMAAFQAKVIADTCMSIRNEPTVAN